MVAVIGAVAVARGKDTVPRAGAGELANAGGAGTRDQGPQPSAGHKAEGLYP